MPFLHPPISAVVSRVEWVPVSYNFSTKGGFGLVFKRVVMGNSKSRFVIFTYTHTPWRKQIEWFIPFRTSTHVKFTQRPSPFEGLTAVLFRFEQEKFDWAALRHLDCIQWLISGSGGLGLLITIHSLCQNPKRNESLKHHFSGNMVVFVSKCVYPRGLFCSEIPTRYVVRSKFNEPIRISWDSKCLQTAFTGFPNGKCPFFPGVSLEPSGFSPWKTDTSGRFMHLKTWKVRLREATEYSGRSNLM